MGLLAGAYREVSVRGRLRVVSMQIRARISNFYNILVRVSRMTYAFYKNCIRCGCNNVVSNVSGGNHLFIDIECLQWLNLAANMGYKNWPGVFTISQIPSQLVVNRLKYKLVSVIEYIDTSDPKDIGHYVASGE